MTANVFRVGNSDERTLGGVLAGKRGNVEEMWRLQEKYC